MFIQIQFNTEDGLSDEDKAILRALGYMDEGSAPDPGEAPAASKPAPAKKTAAKKTTTKKAAASPPPSEPEDESPAPDDTSTEDEDSELRDDAVARAQELLSSGQRDRVLEALAEAGAKKVSAIPADKLPAFMAALTD